MLRSFVSLFILLLISGCSTSEVYRPTGAEADPNVSREERTALLQSEGIHIEATLVREDNGRIRLDLVVDNHGSNNIDISLGALTRTAERAKLIEFTVPLHTEVMAVLTTDKVTVDDWKQLNDPKYTLADMRGNWTVDWLKENLPKAKVSLVDTIADTVRLVGQGRADAIVENIDFFMAQTKNFPDVKWRVLKKTIDVSYDSVGVQRGNYPLRDALNIVLYSLHSTDAINQTWEKWYGSPMLVKVEASPYF